MSDMDRVLGSRDGGSAWRLEQAGYAETTLLLCLQLIAETFRTLRAGRQSVHGTGGGIVASKAEAGRVTQRVKARAGRL